MRIDIDGHTPPIFGVRIFTGGTIRTMTGRGACAEAVAVDRGRIAAVGDIASVRASAPGADEVDLSGGCLLPGFIDAHHHFSEGALFTSRINLHWPAVENVANLLAAVRDAAARTPAGEWVVGEGYDERRLRELRAPTLEELDGAAPDNPVLLVHFSYHEAVVNSRAHQAVGLPLSYPDPPGGEVERDRRGRPTGRMIENASAPFYMSAVHELLERDEAGYLDALDGYQERLVATGLTRVFDPAVSPAMEDMLGRAATAGRLRLPVLTMLSSANGMFIAPRDRLAGSRTGDGDEILRTGPLKMFMDGGVRCAVSVPLGEAVRGALGTLSRCAKLRSLAPLRIAAMVPMRFDLHAHRMVGGILFYSEAEARSLVDDAVRAHMSLALHAEGNVAIDRALAVLPPSATDRAPGIGPNRIEHFFLPDPPAIPRTAEAGIAVAVQPTIVEWTGEQFLATGMAGRRMFTPIRSLIDAGILVAGSSDAPVVDFDPLRGIRLAVTRTTASGEALDDGEEITVEEALELYTINAARSGGIEHETGSIEVGKRADLVLLNADPVTASASDLDTIRVIRTVIGGIDVYRWRPKA